ncbi:alginate lyase family protein [Streptomyces sp. NPDC007205]|uniref:alginate lyase family protein n=1 Tax=Streptomyces sp. NPDC007205 TaxID=3154316 RepID=UPI00340F391C
MLGTLAGTAGALALPAGTADAESAFRSGAEAQRGAVDADRAFFGVWNATSHRWTVPARLDYASAATLAPVERAVKAGDYAGAATHLCEHLRKRKARTLPVRRNGVLRPELVDLVLDHIWTLGAGEILQDSVTVTGTDAVVEADVTDALIRSYASGYAAFFLMARHKEPSTAVFHSRSATSGRPTLVVTGSDGTTVTIVATADTYITAGADAKRVFGHAAKLQVRDEGPGAFTARTRKAYVAFQLKDLANAPKSAVLRLTGRNATSRRAKQVLVYQTRETFDEATRCWANTVQNTFSWQGDRGGFDWKGPVGSDPEYGYQLARFSFAGPMAEAYRKSGDEKIAAGLAGLMLDFVHDADRYGTPYGAGSFPRSLDSAARVVSWLQAYEILRSSTSLTPHMHLELLRTLDKSGQYLARAGGPAPNWMQAQKWALASLALYFPELVGSPAWLANARDFLAHQLSHALYPDGGYTEATDGYAHGVAATFVSLMAYFRDNGHELGGAADLRRLAHFLADQNLPGGWGPSYGDSGTADRRPAFARLANALGDEQLRYVATDGRKGVPPRHTSVLYPDTRVAVLRDGWRSDASYLRINADRGPHAHPDDLALTVYAHGRLLLPNMGAFTYSSDPRSNWLRKRTESANTIEIDRRAQVPGRPGKLDLFATNDVFDFVRAWSNATSGVRHTRTVLFLRHLAQWIVVDRLDPADNAPHTYRQNWHFLPDAHPAIDHITKMTTTRFADGANLQIVPADAGHLAAQVRDGWYSPAFYTVTEAPYVTYTQRCPGPAEFATALIAQPHGVTTKAAIDRISITGLPAPTATALVIRFSPQHTATLCLAHSSPPGVIRFGSFSFDGVLAHIERDGERQSWLLLGGRRLIYKKMALMTSPTRMPDVAVHLDPATHTVALTGSRLIPSTDQARALRVHAPWAKSVTVNGRHAPVARHGGTILAAALR